MVAIWLFFLKPLSDAMSTDSLNPNNDGHKPLIIHNKTFLPFAWLNCS